MYIEKDCLYHLHVTDHNCDCVYNFDMYFRRIFVDDNGFLVLNFSDSLEDDAFFVNIRTNRVCVQISPYYSPDDVIRPRY